jgi:RNA polymerase sigma factor (sigma-70 family)
MTTDRDLLQRYLRDGSQDAFADLVRRHINLVYGAAFRQLRGNVALTQDVTQAVFTALASKAPSLASLPTLSSWLYTTTRYTVSHTVRQERRRQDRESKAFAMNETLNADSSSPLAEIPAELVGTALEALDDAERQAVLLRCVEEQAFSSVGLALGISEDAARMRTHRALEKVRAFFARKGITSTTAAVAAAVAGEGMAAPAGLAGGVCAAALVTQAAVGAGSGAGLFSVSAAKLAAVAAVALAVAAVAYSLRPAPPRPQPAAPPGETLSQHLAALKSKKAASATGLEAPGAGAARPAAFARPAADDARARELASARKVSDEEAEQATLREKMAKLKPTLLSGAPLTGTFVVTRNGQVADVPVSLVLGQETIVELGDSGPFAVTATLNDDGSLAYHFERKAGSAAVSSISSPSGIGETTASPPNALPSVIAAPWGDFAISTRSGAFAYLPDLAEPP